MKKLFVLLLVLVSGPIMGQQKPQIPSDFEPEVRIIDKGPELIEEFRSQGRTYMIKVTPKKGRPYYLVDADGDGNLESHRNETAPRMLIPSWVIFSWK